MSDAAPRQSVPTTEMRTFAIIIYGLYLGALFTGGSTGLVGVILAYVKRGEARGTLWESHFRNLIRVFWIGVAVLAVFIAVIVEGFGGMFYSLATNHDPAPALAGLVFLLVPFLAIAGLAFSVWYLYRTLRGLIHALEDKPYQTSRGA